MYNYYCSIIPYSVHSLCKLVGGEFPVIHSSDYINLSDKKAFPLSKPRLPNRKPKIVTIFLTIQINSQEILSMVHKIMPKSFHFNVIYSGIDFTSPYLQRKILLQSFRYLNNLSLDEIFFDPALLNQPHLSSISLPGLSSKGTMWINTDLVLSNENVTTLLNALKTPTNLVVTYLNSNFLAATNTLNMLFSAFSLLPVKPSANTQDSNIALEKFLYANREVLEYVQLRCYFFSAIPLVALQQCLKLRVLSITTNTNTHHPKATNSVMQIFKALHNLHNLEYLEWAEPANLLTVDLIAMQDCLCNFLPNLLHCHLKLGYLLLSTTDLHNITLEPLCDMLKLLLEGKTPSAWCTTYKFAGNSIHFRHWLQKLRTQTCFCCNMQASTTDLSFRIVST